MRNSRWLRRPLALCVLIAALALVPMSPAFASGGDSEPRGESEDSGLIQEMLDWLVDLIDGGASDPDSGESGPQVEPMG